MGLNSIPPSIQDLIAPVGSIIEWSPVSGSSVDLSTAEKVKAYYGFGTWAAYGAGQVTACVTSGHTAGSTEGERTHTLSVSEMPKHYHTLTTWAGQTPTMQDGDEGNVTSIVHLKNNSGNNTSSYNIVPGTTTEGGSAAHNNMQPTIYIYRWQRIA